MRKIVAAAALLFAASSAIAGDSYPRAREAGLRVIADQLGGAFCSPAPISAASRAEIGSALDGVTAAGHSDSTGLGPLNLAVMADDVPTLQRLNGVGHPLQPVAHLLLLDAALHDSRQALAFLLGIGANPNGANAYGGTALMVAASHGRLEVAQMLLSAGASPDLRNKDGGGALHYALGCKDRTMTRLLTEAGATVDARAVMLAQKHGLTLE